ncbi:hypothetical protein D3C86_1665330 [compost metagenome]
MDADDLRRLHAGVPAEKVFNLGGIDQVALKAKTVLEPREVEELVALRIGEIAGLEPAVGGERIGRGSCVVQVALHDVVATQLQLALLAVFLRQAGARINDTKAHLGRDRRAASQAAFARIAGSVSDGHEGQTLRHAIDATQPQAPTAPGLGDNFCA